MSELQKTIILIDGDNANKFEENMFTAIFNAAKKYGSVTETHLFANRQSAKSEKLYDMITKYAIRFHLLPIKKNSTDISLTIRATEKLYTDAEISNYIIVVAGDHDYMPLAVEIRQHGKKAICFYFGEKDETLLNAFSGSEKITVSDAPKNEKENKLETVKKVQKKLDELLIKYGNVSLQNLGTSCTRDGINYKAYFKTIGALICDEEYGNIFSEYKITTDGKTTYITGK